MQLRCPLDSPAAEILHTAYDVRLPLEREGLRAFTLAPMKCACGARLMMRAAPDVDEAAPVDAMPLDEQVKHLRAQRDASWVAHDQDGRWLDELAELVRRGRWDDARTVVRIMDDPRRARREVRVTRSGRMIARGWTVELLGNAFFEYLEALSVENVLQWKMVQGTREVLVTAQRTEGKTPMELYAEVVAERDAARAELAAARAELRRRDEAAAPAVVLDVLGVDVPELDAHETMFCPECVKTTGSLCEGCNLCFTCCLCTGGAQ